MVYSIQIGGALLILVAFVLGQIELIAAEGWPYLSLNFLGSALLGASAVLGAQWGFVLLEACWALASLYGIWRKLQDRPHAQAE